MKYLRLLTLMATLCAIGLYASAQNPSTPPPASIIPEPVSTQWQQGKFTLNANTVIVAADPSDKPSVQFFNDYLKKLYGLRLTVTTTQPSANFILLRRLADDTISKAGTYLLEVKPDHILIEGDNSPGIFYGIQTLIQLLPLGPFTTTPTGYAIRSTNGLNIPAVHIEDYPRFAYRGLHLDCGRHFFPVEFVKRYIDFIALHKMNYFHWHLTEDQGWRIEIKKYPLLTQVGACRSGTIIGHNPGTGDDSTEYCGYYTQDQIKDIVQYAAARYITVIPEIELPGHSSAALTAYPYLGCTGGPYHVQHGFGVFKDVFCAGNDTTFQFLQDVLDEVIPLFPAKYIHIGGDECPKDSWKACPKCQKRIKDLGLKDEEGLQSYFVQRIEKYINSKGKQIIGWDEILEGGIAPNATIMSWRGEKGG
ncbi:MAG TPA: beta-N-acetylhexosaminidase, partial [Puia sp.]|nr:beta-N-acetylhexosaminidase [Puia sp.]